MTISFHCPHCRAHTEVDPQYAGQSGPCAHCGRPITIPALGGDIAAARAGTGRSTTLVTCSVIAIVLVVVMIPLIGILVALVLPAVQAAREAARRTQCANNLKQIGLAMYQYHDEYECFPPAYLADAEGRPMHSWRVLLLPYLGPEEHALYQQYDFSQPWDSPVNAAIGRQMPAVYRCPSDAAAQSEETSYLAVTGKGTVFEAGASVSAADIADGVSQTMLVVEAAGAAAHWLEPTDLALGQLESGINGPAPGGVFSQHPGGANALMADASVRFLTPATTPDELRAAASRAGEDDGETNF